MRPNLSLFLYPLLLRSLEASICNSGSFVLLSSKWFFVIVLAVLILSTCINNGLGYAMGHNTSLFLYILYITCY